MRKIVIIGKTGVYQNAEVPLQQELLIGRDSKVCQLVYPPTEKMISSIHCKLQDVNGEVYLTDMNSTNGTFLKNGTKLVPQRPVKLSNGDEFYLGNQQNIYTVKVETIHQAAQVPVYNMNQVQSQMVQQPVVSGMQKRKNTWVLPTVLGGCALLVIVVIGIMAAAISQANEQAEDAIDRAEEAEYRYWEKENQGVIDDVFDGLEDYMEGNW